jgi:hypothetical protein
VVTGFHWAYRCVLRAPKSTQVTLVSAIGTGHFGIGSALTIILNHKMNSAHGHENTFFSLGLGQGLRGHAVVVVESRAQAEGLRGRN